MLELDAGWALAGGADPIELLHRYGDRISHVHLRDVNLDSDEVPALGEGTSTSPPSPRRPTKSGPSGSSTRTTSPATPSRRSPRRRRAIAARLGRTVVVFAPVVVFARVGSYLSRDAEFATNARGGAVPTAAAPREDRYARFSQISHPRRHHRQRSRRAKRRRRCHLRPDRGTPGEDLDLRELQDHSRWAASTSTSTRRAASPSAKSPSPAGSTASRRRCSRPRSRPSNGSVLPGDHRGERARRRQAGETTHRRRPGDGPARRPRSGRGHLRRHRRRGPPARPGRKRHRVRGVPAGPRVADSDAIVVVEGRADVLQLLQYGVKNAIAVEELTSPRRSRT